MKTKHEVLLENGYVEMIGYCFKACPCDEEYDFTFVEKDEVESVYKQGAQTYYWEDNGEGRLYDLDEAWERLYDMYYDSEAETMDFVEWEKKILE